MFMNNEKRKIDFKKIFTKKNIIISVVGVVIICSIIFVVRIFNSDHSITIDLKTNDYAFTYGPNLSTKTMINVGDELELDIVTDSKLPVSCYSSNKDVLTIKSKKVIAHNSGVAEVYCKVGKAKSNIIDVEVGAK